MYPNIEAERVRRGLSKEENILFTGDTFMLPFNGSPDRPTGNETERQEMIEKFKVRSFKDDRDDRDDIGIWNNIDQNVFLLKSIDKDKTTAYNLNKLKIAHNLIESN